MKLKEFIKIEFAHDLDVGNDYSDEWYDRHGTPFDACIAFCAPIHFTEEGEKEFKSVMNFNVDFDCKQHWATIKIPGKTDSVKQRNLNKVMLLFYATAGYISSTLFDLWFKDN